MPRVEHRSKERETNQVKASKVGKRGGVKRRCIVRLPLLFHCLQSPHLPFAIPTSRDTTAIKECVFHHHSDPWEENRRWGRDRMMRRIIRVRLHFLSDPPSSPTAIMFISSWGNVCLHLCCFCCCTQVCPVIFWSSHFALLQLVFGRKASFTGKKDFLSFFFAANDRDNFRMSRFFESKNLESSRDRLKDGPKNWQK